ncbi:MAG: CYTH domain-containing protein [Alphaproteobacteria bacterium]|nr:CYTH domain-containing protein [Alphaproteobacteria bacterium]
MAQEIERKFLVTGQAWRTLAPGTLYRQGYLSVAKECTVRVRIAGEKGYMTVKGPTVGSSRAEFEYEIPVADADAMLDALCARPLIEKTRRRIPFEGLVWEVDEFAGDNEGLVVAEVELTDEAQKITLPDWVGEEVTHDPRYFNANLVTHPYKAW